MPFCADEVGIAKLNGDLDNVSRIFGLNKKNKEKLKRVREIMVNEELGETIDLYPDNLTQQDTLGIIAVDNQNILIWLKKETVDQEDRFKKFGIDQHCLQIARLAINNILEKNYMPISLLGWVDFVKRNIVSFLYYDEKGNLIHGQAEKSLFNKITDLSKGSQFIIQTWEESDRFMIDFLPYSEKSKRKLRNGIKNVIQIAKYGICKTEIERAGWPRRPDDWSSQEGLDRYIKEWGEKFEALDTGSKEAK